jgi:hypothetical protein
MDFITLLFVGVGLWVVVSIIFMFSSADNFKMTMYHMMDQENGLNHYYKEKEIEALNKIANKTNRDE